MYPFYTTCLLIPPKKIVNFFIFSGGIKIDQWHEMGQNDSLAGKISQNLK